MSHKIQLQIAEESLASVNSASTLSRALYIGFIALTGYITVNLLSTNDMQILRYAPLRLPLLGVDIHLKGFYALAPWLYVVVLVNMLLAFSLLARKLHHFEALLTPLAYPDRVAFRKRLHVFSLTQVVSGKNTGLLGLMINTILWTTTSLVPVGLLLWIQLRFLPAQEQAIIWSQRGAVLVGAALTFYFWHRIMHERRRALMPENWQPHPWRRLTIGSWMLLGFSSFSIWISVFIAVAPLGQWERTLNRTWLNTACPNDLNTLNWRQLASSGAQHNRDKLAFDEAMLLAQKKINLPTAGPTILGKLITWLPINLSDGRKLRCTFDISHWLSDRDLAWFPRQLRQANNIILVANEPSAEYINQARREEFEQLSEDQQNEFLDHFLGFNLQQRSLRFAQFDHSVLFKVKLSGSQLQGANLNQASLQGANLNGASLQGAVLSNALLKEAKLKSASLQNALLNNASLQGANLSYASLQNTLFVQASLQNATLDNASLQRVNFINASLQGATFKDALLQRAILVDASLQKANLSKALLQGANMTNTSLQAADLSGASLQGANLSKASLQGTKLKNAAVAGALFKETKLQDTWLAGVELSLTDWSSASLATSSAAQEEIYSSADKVVDPETRLKRNKQLCLMKNLEMTALPCENLAGTALSSQKKKRGVHRKKWVKKMSTLVYQAQYPLSGLGEISNIASANETGAGLVNTAYVFDPMDSLYLTDLFVALIDQLLDHKTCSNAVALSSWLDKNYSNLRQLLDEKNDSSSTIEHAWQRYQRWQKKYIDASAATHAINC